MSQVMTFRCDTHTLEELRWACHVESLRTGKQLTPSSVVRDLVEGYVRERRGATASRRV
jgi:hypothetical protein